jgi:hypothetical protein
MELDDDVREGLANAGDFAETAFAMTWSSGTGSVPRYSAAPA